MSLSVRNEYKTIFRKRGPFPNYARIDKTTIYGIKKSSVRLCQSEGHHTLRAIRSGTLVTPL